MTERDEPVPDDPGTRPGDPREGAPAAGDGAPGATRDADRDADGAPEAPGGPDRPVEIGGQRGPEPTRYGDWEGRGRCTDF